MKKIVIWAMCLVLALASGALAKEGSLNEELTEPVPGERDNRAICKNMGATG